METFGIAIDKPIACLVTHLHIFHPVIVFRIVDANGRTHNQTCALFHKLRIQVGAVCMKGTNTVRCIQEVLLLRLGYNVDGTAQCIRSQQGRHHPFINLHPVDQVDR